MAILRNSAARAYSLPRRESSKGVVQQVTHVEAKSSVEVPDWYVEELRKEPGIALLIEAAVITVAGEAKGSRKAE